MSRYTRKTIPLQDVIIDLFPVNYLFDLSHIYSVMPHTLEQISISRRGKNDIMHWRQLISVYHYMNGMTLEESGAMVGRHHTTVVNALHCIIKAMQGFDYDFKEKIDSILTCHDINITATRDVCLNEMISLAYLESEMQKKLLP